MNRFFQEADNLAYIVLKYFDNLEVSYLFCENDPTFPNHHPDPCVEENLADLKKKVLECHADLGVGYDGDADRCLAADKNGKEVSGDELMLLLARRLKNEKKLNEIFL